MAIGAPGKYEEERYLGYLNFKEVTNKKFENAFALEDKWHIDGEYFAS